MHALNERRRHGNPSIPPRRSGSFNPAAGFRGAAWRGKGGGGRQGNARAAEPPSPGRAPSLPPTPAPPALPMAEAGGHGAPCP